MTLGAGAAFVSIRCNCESGTGVTAAELASLAMVRMVFRKGRQAEGSQRVSERFGLTLPSGPARAEASGLAFMGIGVATYLVAASDRNPGELVETLRSALDDVATLSDQSSAYAVLRLSGPCVRDSLAKLLSLDLHPDSFRVNDVACTLAGHVPTLLWRLPQPAPAEDPLFEVAIPRSYAGSFSHLLQESAAEFGFALTA